MKKNQQYCKSKNKYNPIYLTSKTKWNVSGGQIKNVLFEPMNNRYTIVLNK